MSALERESSSMAEVRSAEEKSSEVFHSFSRLFAVSPSAIMRWMDLHEQILRAAMSRSLDTGYRPEQSHSTWAL